MVADLQQRLRENPKDWRQITSGNSEVTADSGRYELGQLPVVDRTNFSEGLMTTSCKK